MRILYLAALVAGASFYFHDDVHAPFALDLIWKASGCALLALWAATRARDIDGWLLAAAFAVYALADAMLDLAGLVGGAATFIVAHAIMIAIYLRHRRPLVGETQVIAALILIAVPAVAFTLPAQLGDRLLVLPYAVVLGAMAAAASFSTFRHDRVLLGALCFVVSDWLIFSKMGQLADSAIPDIGIWPLYFAAQALVVAGVSKGLEQR